MILKYCVDRPYNIGDNTDHIQEVMEDGSSRKKDGEPINTI